jgi:hypothetical protein
MSCPHPPVPAKFFTSLISSQDELICQASRLLVEHLGKIDLMSEQLLFDYTTYYEEEMGGGLFRRFVFFEEIFSPERILSLKGVTDRIEEGLRGESGRRINIDPGYVNSHQVVLATHKNYSHRIYAGDGVYIDLTLIYHNGGFQPLAWTYPDYRSSEIVNLFHRVRERYLQQLKNSSQPRES